MIAADRKGLLRDISSVLSDYDVNVLEVNTHSERSTDTAAMRFTLEVKNKGHLAKIQTKLEQIPGVLDVRRSH